jgi:hypothetical protein
MFMRAWRQKTESGGVRRQYNPSRKAGKSSPRKQRYSPEITAVMNFMTAVFCPDHCGVLRDDHCVLSTSPQC